MKNPNMKWVKPKAGLSVPNPDTGKHLPEAGERVVYGSFWMRRLKYGEITVSDKKPVEKQESSVTMTPAKKSGSRTTKESPKNQGN